MVNKKDLTEEVIKIMKPSIKRALIQTSIENRDDLEQELYLKIVKKIEEQEPESLPSFFEMINKEKEKIKTKYYHD